MRIVTWNIQWGRGADGRVDPGRTIAALCGMGEVDVICLQEVAERFPGLEGGQREDEPRIFAAAFPGYEAVFGGALDVPDGEGGRARFGNLILSRLPVDQVFRHLLPFPADPGVPGMQRGCVEAVVVAPWGPLRVLTTHLEYYSARQRSAQVEALRALQKEVAAKANAASGGEKAKGTFADRPRPVSAVVCGDFNCEPDAPEYRAMAAEIDSGVPRWRDAWRRHHAGSPHAPTVGLHGAEWPGRQYCCDYFWVSDDIAGRIDDVLVNSATAASDHQPVLLVLRD